MLLRILLSNLIRHGTLRAVWPDGTVRVFGSGAPVVTMKMFGRFTPLKLALRPDLAFGEAYMNGRVTIEDGDIGDLLSFLVSNLRQQRKVPMALAFSRKFRRMLKRLAQFNPAGRARRNVAHHYDLSGALYDLFLDHDRQYSCAYFVREDDTLDEAQDAKKRHIASKLNLDRTGLKVLDIGCGWGGLGIELAGEYGAEVKGITLSNEQLGVARERAKGAGLDGHCRFDLEDYRAVKGRFDRIVSVGMFEHVGVGYYDAYFRKIAELLADDGVALVHTIGRLDGPGSTNPWIAKYIFPGGYVPALSEVLPAVERSRLLVTDIEVLRLHYAKTLKAWRARFAANRAKAQALYDERFCRMWEFYLAGVETAFRYDHQAVFQIQLAKNVDSLPLTRDYMFEAERAAHSSASQRIRAA